MTPISARQIRCNIGYLQLLLSRSFYKSSCLNLPKKSKILQNPSLSTASSSSSIINPRFIAPHSSESRLESALEPTLEPSLELPDWDRGGRKENESLTPLYASMRKLIDANPESVCLIQVGSFYELYFEQALTFGPKLNLKVATRKTSSYAVPMAGFPTFNLQKFVKTLVQDLEVNVAIIDQYPNINNESSSNIIHRKISRIISPGTLVDESFLNYNQNNYLAAIYLPANCTKVPADPDLPVGISWIDISVGEFYVQQTTLSEVMTDISRINPSEIVLSKDFQQDGLIMGKWCPDLQELKKYILRYHKTTYKDYKLQFKSSIQATRKYLENLSQREEAAMNMILSYINVNLPESTPSIDVPVQYWNEKCLQMDPRTREALELTERQTSGSSSVVGSLLTTIKRTVTPSGTRLLTQWIKSPILDVEELRRRQAFVTIFKDNTYIRLHLRNQLSKIGDFIRSIQHLSFGTGHSVNQLQSIAESLVKLKEIEDFLRYEMQNLDSKELNSFLKDFKIPIEIAHEIQNTLHIEYEELEPVADLNENELDLETVEKSQDFPDSGSYSNNGIERFKIVPTTPESNEPSFLFAIKRDHTDKLSKLHDEFDSLKLQEKILIEGLQDQIYNEIDPKVNIVKKTQHGKFANVIHISGKKSLIDLINTMLEDDIREKRKASVIYSPRNWTDLQWLLVSKTEQINRIETEIIIDLRNKVLDKVTDIRKASKMVDFLDITSSFAVLAHEYNLVCPRLVKTPQIKISDGRHIVVEAGLKSAGQMFTPNDINIGNDGKLWVISGPNMGGKSTYLRQNALIVILAQIGSFVPAQKASLGIVDKIFTRIGASDDLFSDLSTFMVEMVETSNILKNATSRSLAIVDEVGRGTSGKEGLSIAYATLVHLLTVNKCRSLFATHFGKELENLLSIDTINQDKIRYYRTRVIKAPKKDDSMDFIIDHKLEPGISKRSYAFEVAKLAGFPSHALKDASRALCLLNE